MGGKSGSKQAPAPVEVAPAPAIDFGGFMKMLGAAKPKYPEPVAPTGPSYEDRLREQRESEGRVSRNDAVSGYMDAAGAATDFVNSEISREQSNARLLGIDYDITDDQKSVRINDYFASIWGAGEQSRLDDLMGEFGKPSGFEYTVTRGDGSKYKAKEGSEVSKGVSKGQKPVLASPDDAAALGSRPTLLGA